MFEPIENYLPQNAVRKVRRQAIYVWSGFIILTLVWLLMILLAPISEANGFYGISSPLYKVFSYLCHQIPSRSFQLENHSFAVCSRCFGVYFGLFFGTMVYPVFRSIEEIEPLPRIWLFLALVPMAIDWSLGFLGVWENTLYSRFFTGLLVGTACAVFIIPALVEIFRYRSNKKK